jgi:hypothetical protein
MKSRILRIFIGITIVFAWSGFKTPYVYAASCVHLSCEDLNPNTMGCGADAVTSGSVKILADGGNNQSFVETRKSSACDAKWARTTNKSGVTAMQQPVLDTVVRITVVIKAFARPEQ